MADSQAQSPNKILIIDDHPESVIPLRIYLKKNGYITKTVCNGYDGIIQLSTKIYDFVILDWLMPEIGGMQTLIEADRCFTMDPVVNVNWLHCFQIPVVIYTAHMMYLNRIKELDHFKIVNMFNKSQSAKGISDEIHRSLQALARDARIHPRTLIIN